MEDLFEKSPASSQIKSEFEAYIDGASSGNPGPAGIGVIISRGKEVVTNISQFIGRATNNVAEYNAFIAALEELLRCKARSIIINTDSQLLANQLKKEYKVKNQALRELHLKALGLMSYFDRVQIRHIERSLNKGADKLAVKAIKEQAKMAARHLTVAGGKSELQREA